MGSNITSNKKRIGIIAVGSRLWMGGVSYTELLVKSLRSLPFEEQPEITLIFKEDLVVDSESIKLFFGLIELVESLAFIYPHELTLQGDPSKPTRVVKEISELSDSLDFVFPAHATVLENIPNATWWPDFQHKYLPEFFQAHDIQGRDSALEEIEARAKCVIFSSQDALKDFQKFYPKHSGAVAVLPFFAIPEKSLFEADPLVTVKKYNLPESFFLCSNQFWIHKNHSLIFKALAELQQAGIERHVVFTGQTFDDRHPKYFEDLMQMRADLKLESTTHILGVIPRSDQQQIIRASAAMVQPSLFEGWSTVVEDSRALGKSILLSDLAVHFEQAPRYAIYFTRNDDWALARLIGNFDMSFAISQREYREKIALEQAAQLANNLGRSLLSLAEQTAPLWTTIPRPNSCSSPNLGLA